MSIRHVVVIIAMVMFIVMLSYAIALGVMGPIPPITIRNLSKFYLENAFNPYNRLQSSMTPEAVTAILWDFRGIDTLFEISVFYLGIIAVVLLFRDFEVKPRRPVGLSIIAKTATKIVVFPILVVAAAVALHGHLTPGGGFQAGSIAAVSSAIVIVTFSLYTLVRTGVSRNRLIAIRSTGLAGIIITALLLLVIGLVTGSRAFIMQNQPKPWAPIGLPYSILGVIISGSCLIYNILDSIAVFAAFTLLFILIALFEEDILRTVEKEKEV